MNISQVKNDIKNKTFNHLYIFAGDEWQVQKIYLHKIADTANKSIQYIDSISDIYAKLKNSAFIRQYYTYILRDDKDILGNEKLQDQLVNGEILKDNILILLLTKLDKRTKFYNKFKDSIVEFTHLDENMLVKYIQKDIDLSTENAKRLISLCESDYSRILLEIDKIKRIRRYNADKDFKDLVADGTISTPPYDAIFDFVDAVLRRDINLSFDLLGKAYGAGEHTLTLLSVLYTNAKQVLQVQSCNSSNIMQSTGLTAWQVKCAKEKMNNYRIGELVYMLQLIQETEKNIKIGGVDEELAVEYVLVNVM